MNSAKNNVKATLESGDILELEYGKWSGLELNIVELDCGMGLLCNNQYNPISLLKNLKKLRLNAAGVNELSFIQPLNKIEELECAINNIIDVSPLKNLTLLKSLDFSENSVKDLSPLENLVNLEKLSFSDNCVENLAPIAKIKNLKYLNFLYQCPLIKDLTPLKLLKNLEIGVIGNLFESCFASYDEIKRIATKYKIIPGLINGNYQM